MGITHRTLLRRGLVPAALLSLAAPGCSDLLTGSSESQLNEPIRVTSVDPAEGGQGQTLEVRILGGGFVDGVAATWERAGVSDPGVTIQQTVFVSDTEVLATVTIAPDADAAAYDVAISAPRKKGVGSEDGKGTIVEAFRVKEITNGYEIVALGLLFPSPTSIPGFAGENNRTQARAINDRGMVVGTAEPGYRPSRAFGWSDEDGVYDLLGTAGYVYGEWGGSAAYGLNVHGATVGGITDGPPYSTRAYLLAAGSLTLLEPLAPGHSSVATGINDAGTVVGLSFPPDEGSDPTDAWVVVWHRHPGGSYGAPIALPLGVRVGGSWFGDDLPAVNGRGDVVATATGKAFLWLARADGSYDTPIELGAPSGELAWVHGINDSGWAVGESRRNAGPAVGNAILWHPASYGHPITLGPGAARAITNGNRIVGSEGNASSDGSGGKATVWTVDEAGNAVESVDLRWRQGYEGSAGYAVNADGWIAGYSWRSGEWIPTAWRPVE